jgi:hypothetical protein
VLQDLEKKISEFTENSMRVTWQAVTEIKFDPSGKKRTVVPL